MMGLFKWMRENLKLIMIAVVIVFVITCGVMYGVGGGKGADGKGPNDAVAKVNGKKVARADVERIALRIAEQQSASMPGVKASEDDIYLFRKQAVESMGLERELKKEIKARGVKVDRKELKEQVNAIIAQFPTKEEFESYLSRADKSMADFKDEVRFQMEQQKLVDKITSEIKVTDEDLKKFYEDGKDSIFKRPAGSNLLIAVFGNKAAAELAKKALESGAKWDGIMKEQKAENSSKEEKPDFIPAAQLSTEPFTAVKTLEAGKVSNVIQMSGAEKYFLFLKKSDEAEKILSFDEAKDDAVKMIQNQRGRMEVLRLVRKLRKNVEVEIIEDSFFIPQKTEAKPEESAPAKQ